MLPVIMTVLMLASCNIFSVGVVSGFSLFSITRSPQKVISHSTSLLHSSISSSWWWYWHTRGILEAPANIPTHSHWHTYSLTLTYLLTHTHTQTYLPTHTHTHTDIPTHSHTHTHTQTHTYPLTTHTQTYLPTLTHTHTHTQIYLPTHTHTHTDSHTLTYLPTLTHWRTFLVSQHDARAFVASYNPEPTLDSHAASSSPTHHKNCQALCV